MPTTESLERSFRWIREHPSAANLDVPDELLADWILNTSDDSHTPPGFYLSVFTFGFIQQEMLSSGLPAGRRGSVDASRVMECFHAWQLKLGLVEIDRKTDLGVAPLPLFAFPAGEQIDYWQKDKSHAPSSA